MSVQTLHGTAVNCMSCLWKMVTSKLMMKFILFLMTVLILFQSLFMSTHFRSGIKNLFLDTFVLNRFSQLILDWYPALSYLYILFGFFGLFTVLKGEIKYLKAYGILLFVTFALNMFTSGIVISNAVDGLNTMDSKFFQMMTDYDTNNDARKLIDGVQKTFECCGYHGPKQWSEGFRLSSNLDFDDTEVFTLPSSCCNLQTVGECVAPYHNGCETSLQAILLSAIVYTLLVSGGLSISMLLSIVIVRSLKAKILEDEKKEAFPWTLTSSNLNLKETLDNGSMQNNSFDNFLGTKKF